MCSPRAAPGRPRPGALAAPARPETSLAIAAAVLVVAGGAMAAPGGGAGTGGRAEAPELRGWVQDLIQSPRGPFEAIRWYCRDGSVLPPTPGACAGRGGGIQHGAWSERVRELRARGYGIANVLAEVEPGPLLEAPGVPEALVHLLIERHLVAAEDGWIFRGARTYRGALQAEDEEAGARRLVEALVLDPAWQRPARYVLVRDLVRLLPGFEGAGGPAATEIRALAGEIAAKDPAFVPLRNKIHSWPDAGDAGRVRAHPCAVPASALATDCRRLASSLEALYGADGPTALRALAARARSRELRVALEGAAGQLAAAAGARDLLRVAAAELEGIRARFAGIESAADRVLALEASLALERLAFTAGAELARSDGMEGRPGTRATRLAVLGDALGALHGAGLLSARELESARGTLADLEGRPAVALPAYRAALRHLGRVPEWSWKALDRYVGQGVRTLATIEPAAVLYPQDRLRASPLLAYSTILDGLAAEADALAGLEHRVFGEVAGSGIRPLNPGLGRGTLLAPASDAELAGAPGASVLLVDNTVSDLPPVAGVLTRGEGSSLSHVQLLARNLGLPNVVVAGRWLDEVRGHVGATVVVAVSPGGRVEVAADGPAWDEVFGRGEPIEDAPLAVDHRKLDLADRRLRTLAELRASDSGRVVGPKAANLGELTHHFGDAVPPGVVIPFGVFRAILERPLEPDGPTAFAWMREQYAALGALPDGDERARRTAAFLERLRTWIEAQGLDPAVREELRGALRRHLGAPGTYGVFVRSDTNVEDLPGFTGAGLNLTVPNVVGTEAIEKAITRVWASPFTERAHRWRQARMREPEHVYPGVLLQRSAPADRSGVLVTTDVDTDDRAWLSIAVSEGVGGAVDGQSAEEIRVHRATGDVRLLAQAAAARRSELDPAGGLRTVPTSEGDRVLSPAQIDELRRIASEIPRRLGEQRDDEGRPVPADVEFAFTEGKLWLLQIRPFLESKRARRQRTLLEMDRGLRASTAVEVRLDR